MTEKEYKMQLSLGSINFEQAARETKSAKVLDRIVNDCTDTEVHLLVACNPHTGVNTLTRLAVDSVSPDIVICACCIHPAVTSKLLSEWVKRPHLHSRSFMNQCIYLLQVKEGVPVEERNATYTYTSGYSQLVDPNKIVYGSSKDGSVVTITSGNTSQPVKWVNGKQ